MPRAASIAALLDRAGPPVGTPVGQPIGSRAAGTPMDFSIKGHRSLTHEIDLVNYREPAREFRGGVAPLLRAGRLAAVLLEFPFRFAYRPDERRYLDRLLAELGDLPLVVEFRHRDWFNARVLEGLRSRGMGFCAVDLPRLEGLPPIADIVTADLAYIRFHGRNGRDWCAGDSSGRYDYLYSREELSSWLPRIAAMAAVAKRLRIYFNNHARGQAVENAGSLASLLPGGGLPGGGGLLAGRDLPGGGPGSGRGE